MQLRNAVAVLFMAFFGTLAFAQETTGKILYLTHVPLGWNGEPGAIGSEEWRVVVTHTSLASTAQLVQVRYLDEKGRQMRISALGGPTGDAELDLIQVFPNQSFTRVYQSASAGHMYNLRPGPLTTGALEFTVPMTDTGRLAVGINVEYQLWQVRTSRVMDLVSAVDASVLELGLEFRVPTFLTEERETGLAFFNPSASPLVVNLKLYSFYTRGTANDSYDRPPVAGAPLSIAGRETRKFMISELFPSLSQDLRGNAISDGTLIVGAPEKFGVQALVVWRGTNLLTRTAAHAVR